MNATKALKKQERTYLLLVLGVCYLLGMIGLLSAGKERNPAFDFLQKAFTAFPVLAAFLTRRITSDKDGLWFSLKVWKNWKLWAVCAFVPGILIGVGAALYYLLFPQTYTGIFNYGELAALIGMPVEGTLVVQNPLMFWLIVVLISALFIPLQLLELGEEVGWRGYILPKQIALYGTMKAVLFNGFWWGMAHMPLIYFGFNYSLENWLAPWSNMFVMMLMCMVLGVILSYVTIKSKNCMYAGIIHGIVNIAAEVPVFLSLSGQSGLLGPNPTGLIGMLGLMVYAAILLVFLWKNSNLKKS